jgi:16S rRNA (uracil1498-N3)-methyltransferase
MPGSIRLFVDAKLDAGAEIALSPGQAYYLGTVMRGRAGDLVALFNGSDGEWQARLAALDRGAARCIVERRTRTQEPEPDLWLVFALLKRNATDLVVQKATELGAAALWPVLTARTNAERANMARLHAIAVEATEQSERLTVPALHPPRPLRALLSDWPAGRPLFAAIERASAPPAASARGKPAGLLVGPEGGFAGEELDLLRRHPFVVAVSLGPRILRAETAAIVGLALLQSEPISADRSTWRSDV